MSWFLEWILAHGAWVVICVSIFVMGAMTKQELGFTVRGSGRRLRLRDILWLMLGLILFWWIVRTVWGLGG
jgi:hypothetical protein